jgi:hypothetical protein
MNVLRLDKRPMEAPLQQCLALIIYDNVDEVLWALNDTYFWFCGKRFTDEIYQSNKVWQRFLNQISHNLVRGEVRRRVMIDKEVNFAFRHKEAISRIIQPFLETLTPEEGVDFLGKLTAVYALAVPEPLFRVAKSFAGLHKTPDIPAIDDNLLMTDDMILFAWQYFWFYTWLGH